MTSATQTSPFADAFAAFAKERGGDAVHPLRERAMARFLELGLPTPRIEEWKYTDVTALGRTAYALARPGSGAAVRAADVARLGLAPGLVFVDGHYRADLSLVPEGVAVLGLAEARRTHGETVRRHLGAYAGHEDRPFVALNAAFLEDGVFLHVPKDARIAEPVHVLHVASGGYAAHPRHVLLVEGGAEATLVETWTSLGDEAHFSNPVLEIAVGPNARFDHVRLQCENDAAWHVSTLAARVERDARFRSHTLTFGGALVRNDSVATLADEGCEATLNGLFLARGTQHVDNHTWIEHRKPHGTSHELYKGILDDRARGVFSGYIHVFEDAQKTDAFQSSSHLLLSDDAIVDSQPQLEIYADDVKCSHGSTVGQLDLDALFYLRSRGLDLERARSMLVRAFANDVVERLGVPAAEERIDRLLGERLPGGGT